MVYFAFYQLERSQYRTMMIAWLFLCLTMKYCEFQNDNFAADSLECHPSSELKLRMATLNHTSGKHGYITKHFKCVPEKIHVSRKINRSQWGCWKALYLCVRRHSLHRGSNMSGHLIQNLLNRFGKTDIVRGIAEQNISFTDKFNKISIKLTRMLARFYLSHNSRKTILSTFSSLKQWTNPP